MVLWEQAGTKKMCPVWLEGVVDLSQGEQTLRFLSQGSAKDRARPQSRARTLALHNPRETSDTLPGRSESGSQSPEETCDNRHHRCSQEPLLCSWMDTPGVLSRTPIRTVSEEPRSSGWNMDFQKREYRDILGEQWSQGWEHRRSLL